MVVKVSIKSKPEIDSYLIWIASKLLQQIHWLPKNLNINHIVVITDDTVKYYYAKRLIKRLKKITHSCLLLSFPAGEKSKNAKTQQYLVEQMMQHRCGKDTLCIALGGGVVGDLTGYLAAIYMRGIPYIQIPTTLLAMVDSSVGGKTGINTSYGKNLIGAFHQPKAVVADIDCLNSLSKKQFINGMIEALKMFLTSDKNSFAYLQKNLDHLLDKEPTYLKNLLHRAIKIKANIVQQDEKENHLRMILNFGHTIGHALEHISSYKILHGHAVAFGILIEAKISQMMDIFAEKDYLSIQNVLFRLGFNSKTLRKFDVEKMIDATRLDKKTRQGKVNYILLKRLGQVHVAQEKFSHPVPNHIVKQAFLAVAGTHPYGR